MQQPVSKLPATGTTIFTVMSALAQQHGAINVSQGFPNYDPPLALRQLVARHLEAGHNQYAPMAGLPALRQVLAQKHEVATGQPIDADTEITITAGATQALFTAIAALVHPGDEVIVLEPAYDSYAPAVALAGGTVVPYRMQAPDYRIDWQQLGSLFSERTRLFILNTPHNPTGRIWKAEDWAELSSLAERFPFYILSDEVYEQLVFDGHTHLGLQHFEHLRSRGMSTYSFGKTFHSTGWKIGYCIGAPALMAEFRKVHQFNVFSVNTPMQYALADYLADPATYAGLSNFYQQKRDYLLAALEGSAWQPLPCEGTYFQLFDYSALRPDLDDQAFARWLTQQHKVAVIPVSAFSTGSVPGHLVRVCFAKTEETLHAAAEAMRGVR